MTHHVTSRLFETTPGGVMGEEFVCSCGSRSTAARMAGTPGGRVTSALFGHCPCAGIQALWTQDVDEITVEA